jgi:precorrin-6A/cobalt-precorrin-6A reductase
MNSGPDILVIAGTREAHSIVAALVNDGRQVRTFLPETERGVTAASLAVPPDVCARRDAFAPWLDAANPDLIIDAGHPFEPQISCTAHAYAASALRPYLRVLRPPWTAQSGDHWMFVPSVKAASAALPVEVRAFSNTGSATQDDYAGCRARVLYLRRLAPTTKRPPFDFMQYKIGQAPFSEADEMALFSDLQIDYLITRNVGGDASGSKLTAARRLGIPVIMVERPTLPTGADVVETAQDALDWVSGI